MAVTVLSGISMVNSIPVVTELSKGGDSLKGKHFHQNSNKMTFPTAKMLQYGSEGVRMDSENYYFTTYGSDRQLRFSDYRSQEYHY